MVSRTQPSSEHTPTPWTSSHQYLYAGDRTLPVASGQQDWATDPGGPNYQEACANAAFIVEAVNSHAALVKALEEIARQHKTDEMCEAEVDGADFENAYDIIIGRARAAISHRSSKT